MTMSGRQRKHRNPTSGMPAVAKPPSNAAALREFAYLDEVSVQSLLVSQVGALPSEITFLSSQSSEAELSGKLSATAPLVGSAEFASRFAGSSSTSNQVLSRAVAESLFKHLYELVSSRLVWSPKHPPSERPIAVERGALIEIEVDLAPDPIYGFNATMGVLSDIAEDYPTLVEDGSTALILAEAGPITKVLERLLVGLIPIKAAAPGLRAGMVDGTLVSATPPYFTDRGIETRPLHVVGVTEQRKYWRDVRRVLFSKSTFTILGRIGRSGVQESWTPVKLTEVMRDVAPQFPEAITAVGRTGYSKPVNLRQEANRNALERALLFVALEAGGQRAVEYQQQIEEFARTRRMFADTFAQQTKAFEHLIDWLIESRVIAEAPENVRELRAQARQKADLQTDSAALALSDFATSDDRDAPTPEALIDLEVIAIYW